MVELSMNDTPAMHFAGGNELLGSGVPFTPPTMRCCDALAAAQLESEASTIELTRHIRQSVRPFSRKIDKRAKLEVCRFRTVCVKCPTRARLYMFHPKFCTNLHILRVSLIVHTVLYNCAAASASQYRMVEE